jgi:hypothetical protein
MMRTLVMRLSVRLKCLDARLRAQYTIYAMIMTILGIIAYAAAYPLLKAIIEMALPGMGEVEGMLVSLIPLFILIFILWGAMYYTMPHNQR